jgi:hypothetical protein
MSQPLIGQPAPGGTPFPGWVLGSNGQYMPAQAPTGGAVGLDWNLGTGQLAVGGLTALGNLWNSWQANQLARDSFGFQKRMGEANLANSIQSYNTQLADRARARGFTEGQNPATTQAYIDQNRLPPR